MTECRPNQHGSPTASDNETALCPPAAAQRGAGPGQSTAAWLPARLASPQAAAAQSCCFQLQATHTRLEFCQFTSSHKNVRVRLMRRSTDGSPMWFTWAGDGLHLALGQSGAFHSAEGPQARPARHSAAAAEAATAVRGRLRAWLTLQHTSMPELSARVRRRCHRASSKRGRASHTHGSNLNSWVTHCGTGFSHGFEQKCSCLQSVCHAR